MVVVAKFGEQQLGRLRFVERDGPSRERLSVARAFARCRWIASLCAARRRR